ncbi:MAG: sugar ABC transporter permease [Clostridia bacterium]
MKMRKYAFALSLPFICGFLLFYVMPFFYSIYYSVIESAFSDAFVGPDNYVSVFSNKYYRLALTNTLEFTLIGVPMLVLLSLVLALMLHGLGGGHGTLRGAFILPMLLPTASVIPIVSQVFGNRGGAYLTLKGLGLGASQLVRLPIYLLYFWKNAGFNVILIMAALMMIPKVIYEAAALDGACGFRRFRSITLPLIGPTLFFVMVLSVVQSLRVFKEAYLLYGAYPDPSIYLVQHYMNNHFYKLNYQNLTSGAIMFALIVYLLVAIGYRFERRMDVTL